MKNLINKIKQFFRNIISRNKIKRLEMPKETNFTETNLKINSTQMENNSNKLNEKKEFFEIYNKVKNGQYNLNELTEEQSKKIIAILNSEISIKKDKLNHDITELNILKAENRIEEKNRIFELYNRVKNETINLNDIEKEDLQKIRKLLLEEAKMQDEKLEDEIQILEILKKVS